jgi:lysophospholipase L1-like esterase
VITGGYRRLVALGALVLACCLGLSLWIAIGLFDDGPARAASPVVLERGPAGVHTVAQSLGACEQRIEHQMRPRPTMAIVGASYTAGVGPGSPAQSWAAQLARRLHWNAVIVGVPGAGYVKPGDGRRGPMQRLLADEQLARLRPALVIVQAGHDDVGVPGWLESRQVGAAVIMIKSSAPGARIALLTTFAGASFSGAAEGTPSLRGTDHAIVAAGRAADPQVIVMDPLAGRWQFARAADGLHPTAAGDQWIARTTAAILLAHGVQPAAASGPSPLICDASVGATRPAAT